MHCCLYFLPPYGHSLRQTDIDLLRRLHKKVNVVLVIGKADALTATEMQKLKANILDDLETQNIQLYQFPDCDSDEDEDFKQQDRELKASIPFAVVGSNTVIEVAGKKIRGRQYPWGVVDVENPQHSDFMKLRRMLISTHMQDLKDTTQDVHYENFRAQCISQISQHALRDRGKLKRESVSSTNDGGSIADTDRLLLQKDEEVCSVDFGCTIAIFRLNSLSKCMLPVLAFQIRRMQDMLTQMQEKLKANALIEQLNKKSDNIIDV